MAQHQGRVVAADERTYAVRFVDGSLTVETERLVVQGGPHRNGRARQAVITERAAIRALHLRCGLFGARLTRELPAGYRSDVIRLRDPKPLLADLRQHAWPTELTGWRRPRS